MRWGGRRVSIVVFINGGGMAETTALRACSGKVLRGANAEIIDGMERPGGCVFFG